MKVVQYADLTWPEVRDLPRDLPMLVPIGLQRYDLAAAGRSLGIHRAALLPSIPYGYPTPEQEGLGKISLGKRLFSRILTSIQRALDDQGFRRVVFLDSWGIGKEGLSEDLEIAETPSLGTGAKPRAWRWPADLSRRVVVVSLGHTEQHSLHLPLSTDTVIVQAIADGLRSVAPRDVRCLPAWPYGVSTHTREFAGTLNLGGRLFEDFFLAVVGRLVASGARMIYFSNAHGGNHSFLVNVVKLAGERWPEAFVATEWLHTTGPELERYRTSGPGGMGHACELETSYLLHLRPDLVHMDRAQKENDFITTPNFGMDWIEDGRLIANPPWSDDTATGAYGDPTLATPEKGRLWLSAAIQEKVAILAEIQEQFERRSSKRLEGARILSRDRVAAKTARQRPSTR
ncbi:MAG TPA: creatininase family protein [Anaerolineales bacterium]|nr:creatininase family protein [Anaerolineales bacterium]